jgi:CRISPR-associated protein Csx10
MLPTPESWRRQKGNQGDVYDFAIEPQEDDDKQWQGVDEPFCSVSDDDTSLASPDRHIAIHTARDRRYGRPRRDSGAVYRYDALAAGQTFAAAILCDHDPDAAALRPLLTGTVTLGGSRTGGYGHARLENVREPLERREVDGNLATDADGLLVVTLLSDSLLRDSNGQGQFVVDPDVVTQGVSVQLGVPLQLRRSFLRGQATGGFNRKWGLPLPQALAVHMGSVFVYAAPPCQVRQFQELEWHGIGERRAEGFGRVVVNWQTRAKLGVVKPDPPGPPAPVSITEAESRTIAQGMVARMLRKQLDERLVAAANLILISHLPRGAQLSRLRNIIRDELMQESPDPGRVGEFLARIRERSTARKQFERARVGSTPLLDWLEGKYQATSETEWRGLLNMRPGDLPKVGDIQAEVTDALRAEYVLRFIDAVLSRAAKVERKEVR